LVEMEMDIAMERVIATYASSAASLRQPYGRLAA
jgi:hypothetical protein